jgi:hypothetical protein
MNGNDLRHAVKKAKARAHQVAAPSHTCSLAHTPTTQPPNHPTKKIVS